MCAAALPPPYMLFNNKLADFVEDLRPVIGHMADYKMFASSVSLMTRIDERKNQELFDRFIASSYEHRIMACDETFFMHAEYEELQNVAVVQLLKNAWSGLSASDKEAVWAHLHVLIALNRRCCKHNPRC